MPIHRTAILGISGLLCLLAAGGDLLAQCELQKLVPAAGEPREYFGYSIDLMGDTLVVGAPGNTTNGPLSGAAYVFRHNGSEWIEEDVLRPARAGGPRLFAHSVGVSGDAIIVGIPNANPDEGRPYLSGAAHVYRFDGAEWTPEATLTPGAIGADIDFAWSADISGDVAVAGSERYGAGLVEGAAFVFRFDGLQWVEEAALAPSGLTFFGGFGYSVSVSGDVVLVGARRDADAGPNAGSAYVFRYDGSDWVEEAKLAPADLSANEHYGLAVDVSGDTALVGAPRDDDNGALSGSAYVYRFNGAQWIEEAKLLPTTGGPREYFGYSVSISGDMAVVGAHFDGGNGPQSGAAYVFGYDGFAWTQQAKLTSSDGVGGDYLGRAVAVSGTTVAVAAPRDDDQGIQSGSAYVFGACPSGTTPARSDFRLQEEPDRAIKIPVATPRRSERNTFASGVPGMGHAGAALVREDSYSEFLDELLYTHFGDDRGIFGPEHELARDAIVATLSGFGLAVTLEPFTFQGETFYNVVGTMPGTTFPDEEYIVGAHYDSGDTGGADDNASGVALVLEAARVLSRYESQRTIRFIAFDAEERGVVGGHAYVDDHLGDDIRGMISTDMVAWNDGTGNVDIACRPESSLLEGLLVQAVVDYGEGLISHLSEPISASDNGPFEAAGFQACAFREHDWGPYYHTPLDNMEMSAGLDMAYATQIVRIAVGWLVDAAGVDTCAPFDPVTVEPTMRSTSRFLTMVPGNAGQPTAIRVTLSALYHPDPPPTDGPAPDFGAYEGEVRWVGPPVELPEFNEAGPPYYEPTFMGAMLQCEPYFADFGSGGLLYVYGAEVMPESVYEVQTLHEACDGRFDDESLYSETVAIATARWGDVVEPLAGPLGPPQPDFLDIAAIVKKFQSEVVPTKAQAMLQLNVPPVHASVDFRDIALCVDAFMGYVYPYDGPCDCPSTATCPSLDACERCTL